MGKQSSIEIVISAVDKGVKTALSGITSSLNSVEKGTKAYTATMSSLTGASNTFLATVTQIAAAIGGANLFGKAAGGAIEFNSTVESSKIGMAALLRTFLDFPPGADAMSSSMAMANDIQKKLQIEGLKTTATYQELLAALQQALGPALAAGFSTDQVVTFTSAMVQAAGAIGVPMHQLGQEVRSILDGTISADSRVAKVLGVTNAKMKEMIDSGKGFDFMMEKLKAFTVAGDQLGKSFSGSLANLKDAFELAFGTGLEGAFVSLTGFLQKVQGALVTIDKEANTFTFNQQIVAALDEVDAKLSEFLNNFSTADLSGMIANFIGAMGELAVIALDVAKGIGELWISMGPLAPLLVEITAKFFLWKTALGLLLSLPLTLAKNVIGLNAAFKAMAGMSMVQWGASVVSALKGVELATMSMKTALGAAAGSTAALYAGFKIGEWLAMRDAMNGVAEAHKNLAFNQRLIAKQFIEISKATGVTVTSLEEVTKAVDEGRIHQDEATGAWKAGAKGQAEATKRANDEMGDSAKELAKEQKKAQKDAVDNMRDKYKAYVDTIKKMDKQLADSSGDTYAKMRDMARTGMSDLGAWKDLRQQANEYTKSAKAAATAGDFELAIQNAKAAQDMYAELNTEVKKGEKVLISQPKALEVAMAGVKKAGEIATAAMIAQREEASKGIEAMAAAPGFDKLKETMSDVELAWLANWQNMGEGAAKELAGVKGFIQSLPSDVDIKVHFKSSDEIKWPAGVSVSSHTLGGLIGSFNLGGLLQKLATGGSVRNILSGGFLPGFGGGDRRLLYGEDGEVMINKTSVRGAGLKAALAFNAGRWDIVVNELLKKMGDIGRFQLGGVLGHLPAIPRLAVGGQLGAGASGIGNNIIRHEHVISIGNSPSATVYSDDLNAGKLINMLKRAERLRS